jgi:hypothetical protein
MCEFLKHHLTFFLGFCFAISVFQNASFQHARILVLYFCEMHMLAENLKHLMRLQPVLTLPKRRSRPPTACTFSTSAISPLQNDYFELQNNEHVTWDKHGIPVSTVCTVYSSL